MVRPSLRTISALAMVAIASTFASHMFAQTVVENSAEARFQLDLHVPDAALNAMTVPMDIVKVIVARIEETCP